MDCNDRWRKLGGNDCIARVERAPGGLALMIEFDQIEGFPEKIRGRRGEAEAFVYILRLEEDRWYIGKTVWPKRRFFEHVGYWAGKSPMWTEKYPPVAVEAVLPFDSENQAKKREREVAKAFAHYYGEDRVRGGDL